MHPQEAECTEAAPRETVASLSSLQKAPMDRHKESVDRQRKEEEGKEQDSSEESMDRCTEEKICAEELILEQRKAEEVRSSGDPEEDAMEAWSLFAHPCSLLQYVIRACACRLGLLHDSFRDPKPSAAPAAPADSPSTQESGEDTKTAAGFCMQGVITRLRAVRRPRPPGNPREGSGGNGGHHH